MKSWVFKTHLSINVRQHGQQCIQNSLQSGRRSLLFTIIYTYNHPYNFYQKDFLLLHSTFTSLFHPYVLIKSSLQSALTLPSSTPLYFCVQLSQQSTKKISSLHQPFSQFRLRQSTKELWSLMRNDTILISPFFLKVWTVITGLTITNFLSLRVTKLMYCRKF